MALKMEFLVSCFDIFFFFMGHQVSYYIWKTIVQFSYKYLFLIVGSAFRTSFRLSVFFCGTPCYVVAHATHS
jgi:hypothetical protein